MNAQQVIDALTVIDLVGEYQQTGNPEWARIYIQYRNDANPGPVMLGRASIYRGQLDHIKWYVEAWQGPVTAWCFFRYQWEYWMHTNRVLTREHFADVVMRANAAADKLREDKKDLRAANPHPTGRRRPALAPPNPHRFISAYLREEAFNV